MISNKRYKNRIKQLYKIKNKQNNKIIRLSNLNSKCAIIKSKQNKIDNRIKL